MFSSRQPFFGEGALWLFPADSIAALTVIAFQALLSYSENLVKQKMTAPRFFVDQRAAPENKLTTTRVFCKCCAWKKFSDKSLDSWREVRN